MIQNWKQKEILQQPNWNSEDLDSILDQIRSYPNLVSIKEIKSLLDKKVLNEFNEAIKDRKNKGLTSNTTFIGINSADIKNYSQINNMFEVTVDFVSEIISSVQDKDKKLISGDPEKVKKVYDTWKFSRDVKSLSPNWILIDTQA